VSSRRCTVALAGLAIALSGCSEDVRAQMVITVEAQTRVQEETASLDVVVHGGPSTAEISDEAAFEEHTDRPLEWPRVFAFAPEGGDASRALLFSATARDIGGNVVGETRVLRAYAAGRVIRIRLVLTDACRGIVCPQDPEPMRCENGACVPADVVPEPLDAGLAGDAGPPPPCSTPLDCDDGVFCNGLEVCVGGVCDRGPIPSCDDGVGCTEDRCTGATCEHVPMDTLCTAGAGARCDRELDCQYDECNAATCAPTVGCQTATCTPDGMCVRASTCAATEMCCAGTCVPMGCDDGDVCTFDVCAASGCAHDPISTACDDANPCTTGDMCGRTGCRGTMRDCADTNPCTMDSCDGTGACIHTPIAGSCDDGNPCTMSDTCTAGTCGGTPLNCDDGVACTDDTCESGACNRRANDARCPGGRCDPASGCQYPSCTAATCVSNACESATCTDPDTCTRTPRCGAGLVCCAGSCVAPGCSDGNPCTTDTCGAGGCSSVPNSNPCEDGNPCTTGDTCGSGACQAGTPVSCADTNPCTDDSCSGGTCVHASRDGMVCDDGRFCTEGDRCSGTTCTGVPMTCTDLDPLDCTTQVCNEAMRTCVAMNEPMGTYCDDNNYCTLGDRCNGFGACFGGALMMCGPELMCCPSKGCTSLGCIET
jgi:hypothetical protein